MCRSNGVCTCSVRSRLRARLHLLMCTVGVQASVRLDVLLILCQAETSFKKSVQKAPYGALMLESAVERGRDGGKENEGKEGWRERQSEEAFSLAFLPLSLSSPMSKTDGAGALCVCACMCAGSCKCRLMWPTQTLHTLSHSHIHAYYWALPSILPPEGHLRAATRPLPSAVSLPWGMDSSSAVSLLSQLTGLCLCLYLLIQNETFTSFKIYDSDHIIFPLLFNFSFLSFQLYTQATRVGECEGNAESRFCGKKSYYNVTFASFFVQWFATATS